MPMLVGSAKQAIRYIIPRTARNWLRSPTKSARYLWDTSRYRCGVTETVEILPGRLLKCHPIVARSFCKVLQDQRQREELVGFASLCSRSMVLFDIGASFGLFTVLAALYGARVIAVEPSPLGAMLTDIQARLNDTSGHVTVVPAAVSDRPGTLLMLNAGVFSDGFFSVVPGRDKRELTETRAMTLDELVKLFGPPTHIKIDVEGHEAAVLRGGFETLMTHPVLFVEMHSELARKAGTGIFEALHILQSSGYSVERNGEGNTFEPADLERNAIMNVIATRT